MGTSSPLAADLLILRTRQIATVFLVGSVQDHAQRSFGSYDEALRYARTFGQDSRVDVWRTDDGTQFTRVAQFRQVI